MGNLADDTIVKGAGGHYEAVLSGEWDFWGPNGGYVAALGLRAVQAHSTQPRLASMSTHFLSTARHGHVDIEVTTLRATQRAESIRVRMTQEDRPICETLVWMVATDLAGVTHDHVRRPDLPGHEQLLSIIDLMGPGIEPPMPIFHNIEWKPFEWQHPGGTDQAAAEARWSAWWRFLPQATFEDPFVDAARAVILLDLNTWAAGSKGRPYEMSYFAPTIDLSIQFHQAQPDSEWLLVDGMADFAKDGLVSGQSRLWSSTGTLIASGFSSLLCKEIRT
ncbi:thioesterase family protein [Microtetraspora malaysiensis]|uniref:thioesterase family protein n=1 Tax=Microtetraspora malaysiensis TaxID=161358 RepID=UPI000831B1D5|nr:thioesterase family protein [Microtetraspora malaysiensis]